MGGRVGTTCTVSSKGDGGPRRSAVLPYTKVQLLLLSCVARITPERLGSGLRALELPHVGVDI
jgi:hypothetical protein